MWDKIKNVAAVIGGIAIAIVATLLGRRLRNNRERTDAVGDNLERASGNNQRAREHVDTATRDADDAIADNRRASDDNKRATDIIRRVRERGPKADI